MTIQKLPVVVIGAGPAGLAAAAHLLERGETPIVFEAGDRIGASVRAWGHVRMFSPWEFTVDSATVRHLTAHGWQMPPKDELPTGDALVERYMQPFADLPDVRDHIHLNARVVAVSRHNIDKMKDAGRDEAPFVLHVVYANGEEALIEARAVIDASGTWTQPNPLGSNGLPAVGEKRSAGHIFYGIPDVCGADRERYANRRVMVVGSGHSAINALLTLAELKGEFSQTEIAWAMRGKALQQVYGGGTSDQLSARGRLGTRIQALVDAGTIAILSPFRIRQIALGESSVDVIGETPIGLETVQVDEIIATTGARPQLDILRELRLDLDSSLESTRALAPMIDPNLHSCGTVRPHGEAELRHPERDFYIVGMKSYGRAPTFLLATGYEQVRSVVAALAGDWEAARDVQLCLPETGVCSTDLDGDGGSCCTTTANVQPALLSLDSIGVNGFIGANGFSLQPLIALQTITTDSGSDPAACCDSTCCS
ncbi:MAG: FAD-dependent oxidoreductase [Chloroflexota bacterium]|nr:FAD-dependent oxidoreductase [Chloroflexota bacterium]